MAHVALDDLTSGNVGRESGLEGLEGGLEHVLQVIECGAGVSQAFCEPDSMQ